MELNEDVDVHVRAPSVFVNIIQSAFQRHRTDLIAFLDFDPHSLFHFTHRFAHVSCRKCWAMRTRLQSLYAATVISSSKVGQSIASCLNITQLILQRRT